MINGNSHRQRVKSKLQKNIRNFPADKAPSVLFVSGNSTNSAIIEEILKQQGCAFFLAESQKAAMDQLYSRAIDCLIYDSTLPEDSPERCIAELRQSEGLENMPIVLLSVEAKKLDLFSLANGADVICQIDKLEDELPQQLDLLLD